VVEQVAEETMNRRTLFKSFAATAAGLLVPEPVRAYSFVGGWAATSVSVSFPSSASGCILFYDPLRETIRMRLLSSGETFDFCEPVAPGFLEPLDASPVPAIDGVSAAEYNRISLPLVGLTGSWADGEDVPTWSSGHGKRPEDFGT
jgi:hypothetical protein